MPAVERLEKTINLCRLPCRIVMESTLETALAPPRLDRDESTNFRNYAYKEPMRPWKLVLVSLASTAIACGSSGGTTGSGWRDGKRRRDRERRYHQHRRRGRLWNDLRFADDVRLDLIGPDRHTDGAGG
jgi:hypothetical protein